MLSNCHVSVKLYFLPLDSQGSKTGKSKKKPALKEKEDEDKKATVECSGAEEEEEEIPQLVPIESPSKKPKLEVSAVYVHTLSASENVSFICLKNYIHINLINT